MAESQVNRSPERDPEVGRYVQQLLDRWPKFQEAYKRDMAIIRQGWFERLLNEYLLFGNKLKVEGMLHGMMTSQEREQLGQDEKFTQAWRIFVDLRWVQKQIVRGAILAGVILLLTAVAMIFIIQASSVVGVKPLE